MRIGIVIILLLAVGIVAYFVFAGGSGDDPCAGGDLKSCIERGQKLASKDPRRAEELLKTACDAKSAEGCAALADFWARPSFKEPRPLVATRTKACELGLGAACDKLGTMLMEGDYGHRVNVDRVAATEAYAKGCGLDHGPSCTHYGDSLFNGRGVASVDQPRAAKHYERGCELRDAAGCSALAAMVERGSGELTADAERAASLYAQACDAGSSDGCKEAKRLKASR